MVHSKATKVKITMRIWVDADACPKIIKEILFRAAKRTQTHMTLVSNHPLATPPSPFIAKLQVPSGFDVADDKIVELIQPGDLVITADIPLADAVVTKGGKALNPRGLLYTESNIKERLAIRNLSDSLRSSGTRTGGPPTLNKTDVQAFANRLDQLLAQK
jgi:uncharacterized protein YaiI (UPF0178 family)